MFTRSEWKEIAAQLPLSGRELQVVKALFENQTSAEIAQSMEIKPRTVREYFERIYQKLDVHNRTGLLLAVMKTYRETRA